MKLDLPCRLSFRRPQDFQSYSEDTKRPPRSLHSIHTRLLAALLLPLLATSGVPAGAQVPDGVGAQVPLAIPAAEPSALAGRPIESIEFRGLQSLSQETILYYLGLEVGKPLDEAQLNRNLKELWNRGLVDDIEVEAVPSGAGAKIIIMVKERPVLRSIDYQGLKRISKTDIQDKLSSQRSRVREGEPMSLGELHRVKIGRAHV